MLSYVQGFRYKKMIVVQIENKIKSCGSPAVVSLGEYDGYYMEKIKA